MNQVAGIVLAAGAGVRYGRPKALVELHGELLVERAVRTLREAGADPVVVVVGARADEVRARAALDDALFVRNAEWASGMGSSLRAGLMGLISCRAAAVLVLPVDMPGITPAAVRRVAELSTPDVLAAASFDGVRGHPVLLGRAHWAGVATAASGDQGARTYLRDHPPVLVACDDVASGADVDRPEDLPG
ncbi:nucleotidyltransferase family protein [Allokutzneria albata]|uniref:Nicotine blue oxidoreductase n=1 Tax=Allokutzneria albata TaxID=211114 RepID=A0A1H0D4A6_ALLAB|nr:nucleotidyltransferase family protein [Allokutzneria albata]SDN64948.1 nicotine blue oxidoreductase [Allokutzneria albata]